MRGNIKQASTPADAFDVTEFKSFALIADTDFDAVKIPIHLSQAQFEFEELTNHLTTNRNLELFLPRFPVSGEIEIERIPFGSVSSLTYYDLDDVEQTLAGANYVLDDASEPPRIVRASGVSWPSTYDKPNALKLSFIGGYGALYSDVPLRVRHAIYSIARDRFHRLPVLDRDTIEQVESLRWRMLQ